MSDWEDSNDEETNLASINEKSWKQIAEQRYNAGLREASGSECEESLQSGFDMGFRISFSSVIPLSKLRGGLFASQALCKAQCDTKKIGEYMEKVGMLEKRVQEDNMKNMKKEILLTESKIPPSIENQIDELTTTINNYISDTIHSAGPADKNNQAFSAPCNSIK